MLLTLKKSKPASLFQVAGLRWCLQESNQGHKDFQSFALPTELRHRCFKRAFLSGSGCKYNFILLTRKGKFIKNAFVN